MKCIGENIKKFRTFRGITQLSLGESVGRSKNVVSNWERGDNDPDLDTIEKLCRLLKVTPNQMFGWEPCPEYEAYIREREQYQVQICGLKNEQQKIAAEIARLEKKLSDIADK